MNNLKSVRGTTPMREMVKRINRRSIDIPLLSKLENGLCLPTVEAMPDIEKAYCLPRTQLYDPAALDFGVRACSTPTKPRKRDTHRLTCKKTFRLTETLANVLTPEILNACGYATAQDWFCDCIRNLDEYHAAVTSRKETSHVPESGPAS